MSTQPAGPLLRLATRGAGAGTGRPVSSEGLIVQKFGGSSVADAAGIRRVAQRIAASRAAGQHVVGVVSAMGDTTDELCDLAASVSTRPRPRELDALLSTGENISAALLAIALADLGAIARVFTGSRAGIITDDVHGKARITHIKPGRLRACLERGEIPIVAGFQGRTRKSKEVTTLGRGGSDLTAVAIAAALDAGVCEIYTDVDGVYTADPRVVSTARKIDVLSSEEMLELAASGSKVLHLRCVEYARRFGVAIHVRSSFVPDPGTLILPGSARIRVGGPAKEQAVITGVASANSTAKITVSGVPEQSATAAVVFQALAASGLKAATIVQNARARASGLSDLTFTLPAHEASDALATLSAARSAIGYQDLHHEDVGTVSLTGLGMRSSPEIFGSFFSALAHAGIDTLVTEISETCVAAVTRASQLNDAVRVLRQAFGLASDSEAAPRDSVRERLLGTTMASPQQASPWAGGGRAGHTPESTPSIEHAQSA